MTWRNALSEVVIPPMAMAYIALICVLFAFQLHRRRRELPALIAVVALLGLLALATPAVSASLLRSLESGLNGEPPADAPPQAIVILGAEIDETESGLQPGALTLQRLLEGVRLWRRTGLPILVSGGMAEGDEPSIAEVMAATLRSDFQVPVRWEERRSETTWANAGDSAAILLPLGIRSVYVVTHAWHERRAILAFRHFGLLATPAPFPADAPSSTLLPMTGAFGATYRALHEWLGLASYAARDWLAGPQRTDAVPSNKSA